MKILKEVTVEVTQKCNSLCIFCSSLSNSFCKNEIPLSKLKNISAFSLDNGAKTINISGGEPLLRNDIGDYILFNESIGLNTNIYTSGNIADNSIFTLLLEKIRSKKSIKYIFNYPSCQKDVFQRLINSDQFEPSQIDSHISFLIENGIDVETHIVPNALNIDSLYNSIAHLKLIGVRQVSLLRLVLQGRADSNKALLVTKSFENDLQRVLNKIISELQDEHFKIRLGIPFGNTSKTDCECFAGISKLIFRYDGVVFPCEAFKEAPNNTEFMLGNIYSDSLESIWHNHPVHYKLSQLRVSANKINEYCPAQMLYNVKIEDICPSKI